MASLFTGKAKIARIARSVLFLDELDQRSPISSSRMRQLVRQEVSFSLGRRTCSVQINDSTSATVGSVYCSFESRFISRIFFRMNQVYRWHGRTNYTGKKGSSGWQAGG